MVSKLIHGQILVLLFVAKADSIVEIIWRTEFGSQKKVLLNYLEDHHLMERKLLIKVF